MKKYIVTTAILMAVMMTSVFAQGGKNIVRAYQILTRFGNSDNFTHGVVCFYDPGKVTIKSKNGAQQSPIVYYYFNDYVTHPMNSTKATATVYIPGYSQPATNRNSLLVDKDYLVLIKKLLDANKIKYSGDLDANLVQVNVAASVVQGWPNSKL